MGVGVGVGVGGWDGSIRCRLTVATVSSCDFVFDLLNAEMDIGSNGYWIFSPGCSKCGARRQSSEKQKNVRRQSEDLAQKDESISGTSAKIICALFPFGSASFQPFFFLFNCWIIHLRALIYPPSSALYVQPLCETFSWISNELVAYKVSLPGKAPIYGHVCLFFININPLGESVRMPSFQERSRERPWAGSPTVSVSLVSLWLLGW